MDSLFMTLFVLKHGGQWDYLTRNADMKCFNFELHILTFIPMISPIISKNW